MDHFDALFAHVAPSARSFFAGNLCKTMDFDGVGHLHLLKDGELRLSHQGETDLAFSEPTLLFYPRGRAHRFTMVSERGVDLVCATIDLGAAQGNPVSQGLPDLIALPLAAHPALAPACALLVAEGFSANDGRQVALDRLFDYLLILIIRHVVTNGNVGPGVLAGLADPRLAKALTAMHEVPRRAWSLEDLADTAGMSRTRFATHFRGIVGRTPIDYLTQWRMTLASQLLAKGRPVKSVANQVGYESAAAFSRVFARVTGQTPREAAAGERG